MTQKEELQPNGLMNTPDVVIANIAPSGARARLNGAAAAIARANAEIANMEGQDSLRGWSERELDIETWEEFQRKPRVYADWMPQFVYDVYVVSRGVITKKGIARRLGISETTLYEWIGDVKALSAAVHAGEAAQEERLGSYMINSKYIQGTFAVLKNLHKWADKIDETHALTDLREEFKKASEAAPRTIWDKDTSDATNHNTYYVNPPAKAIESPNTRNPPIDVIPLDNTNMSSAAPVANNSPSQSATIPAPTSEVTNN